MMLSEPEDAEYALQDTFVIAAARLGGLHDPRKLRPWLYAVAHNECHLRLGATETDLDEADDPAGQVGPSADDSAERDELRRLIRAALDGLNPAEREVIELGLRHDLHGADLAAVLGVPRNQAHALASRARGQLEKALGVLLVARTGRRACPGLDMLLDGWDGRLTLLTRKRVSRHIDQCDVCTDRKRGALRPAALYGMAPLAALPRVLREEVLGLCADVSPSGQSYRRDVVQRAGPFRPNGFPQPIRPPRQRWLALSGVAAAAGVLIAMVATGMITVLALGRLAHPAAGRCRPVRPPAELRRRLGDRKRRISRRRAAQPVAGHQRAGRRQRGAPGRAVFGLADQGEAVAVGHVVGAARPDADTAMAHTHTHYAHAHAHNDADIDIDADIDGHRHAHAALIFARSATGWPGFPSSGYFVLVSGYVVRPEL